MGADGRARFTGFQTSGVRAFQQIESSSNDLGEIDGWRYIIPGLLDMGLQVIVPDMIGYGQTVRILGGAFRKLESDAIRTHRLQKRQKKKWHCTPGKPVPLT